MLKDIVAVQSLDGYRLRLRFEDNAEGIVDLAQLIQFVGVFAPLVQHEYFSRVRVEPELGTVVWPNGADIDPDVLYALATGQPLPTLEPDIRITSSATNR